MELQPEVVIEQQQSAVQPAPEGENVVAPEPGAEGQQQQPGDAKPVDAAEAETRKALRGVQKRINELTRAKHEAEERGRQEAEHWKQQAIALAQRIEANNSAMQAPVFNGDFEQYARDVAKYESQAAVRSALEREREQRELAANEMGQQQRQAALRQQFTHAVETIVAKGEQTYPGFRERISAGELPGMINTPAFLAILDTGDAAPAILNYLSNNPTKAHEIVALSPVSQVKEIGRIESAIAAGRTVSTAPPPPGTIGAGKGSAPKDPAQMSYDEFVKFRRKQIAARR